MPLVAPVTTGFRTANVDLAASDSTKTIIAAPGAGTRIFVYRAVYISKTSHTATLSLAVSGSTSILDLAASIAAHTVIDTGWLDGGLEQAAATALVATPSGAGPAGKFLVTYEIK